LADDEKTTCAALQIFDVTFIALAGHFQNGQCSTTQFRRVRLRPMSKLFPVRKLRLVLASLLSLWIAGAGCMLGCESMIAMASASSAGTTHHSPIQTVVASGDVCASGEANSSHGCCKKNKPTAKTNDAAPSDLEASLPEVGGSSSGTVNNCPLAMGRAAVVAKSHSRDVSVTPALARFFIPELKINELTAPLSAPLRLPNRGHTYLHCCAFLI
jgi:hypothetical protein